MLENIKRELDNEFDITVHDDNENVLTASCRGWGQWEFPEDMSCEDGEDEDCDYEELSSESEKELEAIMDNLKKDYPGFTFEHCTGDKNYIDFRVAKC